MALIEKSKTVVTNRRHLKAKGGRSTFSVNGQAVHADAIVEASMHDATDLIRRGLAVDATPAEVTAAGANIIVAPVRFEKWNDAA